MSEDFGTITIVIADDHPMARDGIRKTLATVPDFTIIGEAENGDQVKELVDQLHPQVLLLDLVMPKVTRPADIERWVRKKYPATVTATTSPIYFSNPTLQGCVGVGCSLPSGYNDVVDATLNEQSLHAYDPSSKYWTGGGRVETKIRVNGAGVGTVRVYYTYNGVNCNAGYAVYVFKLSGNVNYPNLPLFGYFDVILTSSGQGTFSYYTRCSSSGSHVGDYGIDSLWYSLTDPTTWTPTPTATLTNTPTFTPSPTPTLTSTPTFAPTNTFVPGTPHANGSGTCWKADWSWPYYNVAWRMDTNVPTSWGTSLYSAAQTWTNVTPSPFSFVVSSLTDNTISYGAVANYVPAFTYQLFQGATLLRTYTVFNNDTSYFLFETSIPPSPTSYSVQEIMTHEFGYWLALDDIPTHDEV